MKLQKQVCTLEQAKRLKELGIEQNYGFTYFSKISYQRVVHLVVQHPDHCPSFGTFEETESDTGYFIRAFTVAELGEMLPDYTQTQRGFGTSGQKLGTGGEYWESLSEEYSERFTATTEAETRAAMLIHLIENNLVDVKDVNEQLTGARAYSRC